MQELFNHIISNYMQAKEEDPTNHELASYIRHESVDIIKNEAQLDPKKYTIKGSSGSGHWASVPWIAIFDKEVTKTAQRGYYIVYLFCTNMRGFYLSLNQGWTYFSKRYGNKEGKERIKAVSDAWKKILSSTLNDFSYEPINLNTNFVATILPKGYELGHICGKYYCSHKIPSDQILIDDLRNLLGVYRELKGKLKGNSTEKTNNYLIVNNGLGLLDDYSNETDSLEDFIELHNSYRLIHTKVPGSISSYTKNDFITAKPKKVDIISKTKKQIRLGFAGELMVLEYEREYLKNNSREDLLDRIQHVSKDLGDGAGYDILSCDLNGNKKHIEVKTTEGSIHEPFFITANELEFSMNFKDDYYLYRIYDFNKETSTGKFYCIKGDLSLELKLKSEKYIVKGISN